jgi:hypothetical protein
VSARDPVSPRRPAAVRDADKTLHRDILDEADDIVSDDIRRPALTDRTPCDTPSSLPLSTRRSV